MSGSETDFQWFIARDGKQHGPVSDAELRKLVELSHLKPTDLVWRQGFADWRTAASVFPNIGGAQPSAPAKTPHVTSGRPAGSSPTVSSPAAAPGAGPGQHTAQRPHSPGSETPGSHAPRSQTPGPHSTGTQPSGPKSASQQAPNPQPSFGLHGSGPQSPAAQSPNPQSPTTQQPAAQTPSSMGSPLRGGGPGPHPGGYAPYASAPGQFQPSLDSRRASPGDIGREPMDTRPLGGAQRAPGAFALPAEPRLTTDSRKPSDMPSEGSPRSRRKWAVAAGLLIMTGVGAWISSQYTDQMMALVQTEEGNPTETGAVVANIMPPQQPAGTPPSPATEPAPKAPSPEEVDRNLQSRPVWVSVKQEFPDWYQTRVDQVARLGSEQKSQADITRYLIGELVQLRRENAKHALAASTTRHKELATAFLANLQQLSLEDGDGCYEFISRGEASSVIIERMQDPAKSAQIEAQIVSVISAIVEGRKQPSEHAAPVKTDYDLLAGELGRLGWTQTDMQLFANPKELAKAPRARVCSMLKDWFSAHLAIQDPSSQERLLFETLKPVVSG